MSSTEHDLTIVFTWVPKSPLLRATLPSGASFMIEPGQVHGKLGANLALFKQAQALIEKEATPPPVGKSLTQRWDEAKIQRVAEGTAFGVKPERVRREARAMLQDLEITID